MQEYIFREPPLQPNQYKLSKVEPYAKNSHSSTSLASFWNVATSNSRMHLFFTPYSLAGIRSGLSPPVGRMGRARGRSQGLIGVMILRYCLRPWPHSAPITAALSPPGNGEGWLFCEPQWPLHRRVGKGFGGAQWLLLERWCSRCRGPHWVCAASVPSSGFSCHRYDGALFADSHRAESGNSHHLSHRTLTSSALSCQGHRLSRTGQTITQRYSLSCNEPGIEKHNWAMTADTILGFKRETQKWNGHSNSITFSFIVFLELLCILLYILHIFFAFFVAEQMAGLIAKVLIFVLHHMSLSAPNISL